MGTEYTFPYQMHLDAKLVTEEIAGTFKGDKDPILGISELLSIRSKFDEIDRLTDDFDYVATFALGGMVPLNYITTKRFEHGHRYQDLQRKFHLFAGLNWHAKAYDVGERFLQWIDSLENDSSVLVFDTGNIGTGSNRAYNLLRDHLEADTAHLKRVAVMGIVSKNDQAQRVRRESVGDGKVDMSIDYLRVEANLFEDACHLGGYERLRSAGRVKALRSMYTLVVIDDDGSKLPIPTADAGGAFQWLLRGGIEKLQSL